MLRTIWGVLLIIWDELNGDWIFNLSSLLAYNLLMAVTPSLLVLVAVTGFVLSAHPATQEALIAGIVQQLPPGVGEPIAQAVVKNLSNTAGLALVIGLAGALFLGSRLFIVIEDCFGIIFDRPPRDPLRQNVMAFGMVLMYLVLLPLAFLAPALLDAAATAIFRGRAVALAGTIHAAGLLATFLSGILLFGAIYLIVPNLRLHWRDVWKGTLVAALLLVVYEQVFPLYQARFLSPTNPGAVIGLVLIILIFFYYLAFILLLGAEVIAWTRGPREHHPSIASLLRRRQARS